MSVVWVFRDGEWIDRNKARPLHEKYGSGPMIIGDTMDQTWNPADGRHYDSKQAYYKAVRDAGCEIIGGQNPSSGVNARPELSDPVDDIKQAIERVESRTPTKRKGRKKRGL